MSAGNIKLNLKEFKHVSSDKDSTTLQHKKGHKLVLAHNSLSPESQEQLKSLAKAHYDDGGIVDNVKKFMSSDFDAAEKAKNAPLPGPAYPTTAPQSKASGGKIRQSMKDGGGPRWDQAEGPPMANPNTPAPAQEVSHKKETTQAEDYQKQDEQESAQDASRHLWDPSYADGGEVAKHPHEQTPYDEHLPCLNPNCKSHGKPHPNCRCYGGKMAEGGKVDNLRYCAHGMPHMMGCEYAKGGEVSQQGNDIKHYNKEKQRGNSGAAQQQMDFAKSEAKGRAEFERHIKPNLKGLKDGGKPEDAPSAQDEDLSRDFHHQYMEPDREESQDEQNKGIDKEIEDASSFANPDQQTAQTAPMASEDQQQAPEQPQAQAQPQQQQAPDETGYQDLPAATNTMQQQGNYDPSRDTNPIQRFENEAQNYEQSKQNILQGHINESNAWKQDLMNGHITPLTYKGLFARESTPEKIGTLFGLLLSGAGSGLAHQPNMVLGMMNQEIQNDLAAQQHSKENALNYLRVAQAHELNKANIGQTNAMANTAAIANSKARMDWANFHQIVMNTQNMPEKTPQQVQQKQQAMQALAYMNDEIQKSHVSMFDKLASAQAAASVVGGGLQGNQANSEAAFQQRQKMLQSGMMGPKGQEISRMETARHLPGVAGSASRDISPADADKYNGYKTLDNQLKDLKSAVDQYSNLRGNIDPKVIGPMAVKAHEAAALYNRTLDGLGMTEGRMGWLENQIPSDPQKFMERLKGSKEKLEEVANNNNMRKNTMLNSYGFPAQTQGIKPKPGYTVEQHNGKNYYVPIKKK